MRLFIAIDLPENVKEYLRKLQAGLPDAKMLLARDFHLTLKFLGECDEALCRKVEEQLEQVDFRPLELQLGEIGTFGGKNPRVVLVGIKAPQELNELACEIEDRMKKLDFQPENAFIPHITLARVKSTKNPEDFLEYLKKIKIEPLKFKIENFYLFESKLSPKGALHIKLAEFGR